MGAVQASPASAARGAISSALGPDLARLVQAAVPCSRCKRSVGEAGPCRVPHPASKRRFLQGMSEAGTNTTNYGCEACGCNYSVVIDSRNGTERVEGAQWCYEAAEHVVGPLPAVDCRRVDDDAVELVSDGQLQRRIDALPATTRVLTIGESTIGREGQDRPLRLNRALPALEELRIDQVVFREIVLTKELTPRLRKLHLLQCLAEDRVLRVELPELVEFHSEFYRGPTAPLNQMLKHATKLKTWVSYKCWVTGRLTFASNALKSVDLHRSDSLGSIELWAPNLKRLNVQGCFALGKIIFTQEHPLKALLPPDHRSPKFTVNATNANLGRAARQALESHPCCLGIDGADGPGDPMMAMFQAFHQASNAGGEGDDHEDDEDDDQAEDEEDEDHDDDDDDDELTPDQPH
jgi:hypothetical protein